MKIFFKSFMFREINAPLKVIRGKKNSIDIITNGARKELTAEPYETGNSQVRF